MARSRGAKQYFNFVKGWNTEASPMTFPENTALDLDNVILDTDGSIRRRAGANFDDLDASFADTSTTSRFSTEAIGFFEWLNVAGQGTLAFAVSQFGTTLYFHRQNGPETINGLIGTIDMSSFAVNLSQAKNSVVAVDSGLGYLFVVGKYINPFYVEYDINAETLAATAIDIKIRDFDGLDDGLEISERPTTLSAEHHYNLLNQGWPKLFRLADDPGKPDDVSDPIQGTKNSLDVYPSNADIIYLAKVSTSDDPDTIGEYLPRNLIDLVLGNTFAPKGHYILDAFKKERGVISGVAVGTEATSTRPSAVAFHNGRAFYAGLSSTGRTGEVYFSQQLINISRAGKCYQEQDPTSEDINDLLATDGGVVEIPAAGIILRLAEGRNGIVVFATNGVWEITGTEGKFSATDFFVRKVTDISVAGGETVINADGTFLFWSDSGIIALSPDQITGHLNADNISKNTIQTGYLLIGGVQRKSARGAYITEEKKAVWLYSTDTAYDGVNDRWKFNGVLILDTQLGAFYKYSISDLNEDAAPYVCGIIKTLPFLSTLNQVAVTENGVVVTENGATVTVGEEQFGSGVEVSSWKLLCVRRTFGTSGTSLGLAFGEFNSRTWTDWFLSDGAGANYSSFLETGYELAGNPMVDKQPVYIFSYFSPKSKSLLSGSYYELPDVPTFFCGDISTMSYAGKNKDVTAQGVQPRDMVIRGDGTKMFMFDKAGVVYSYTLSTPGDISTATYDGVSFSAAAQLVADKHGMTINRGGTVMLLTDGIGDKVFQYNLSTGWDLSTASYSGASATMGTTTPFAGDVAFNLDGTKLYCTDVAQVFEFPLSTPYSIATIGTKTNTLDITPALSDCHSLEMSVDDKKIYLLGVLGNTLYQFSMSTPGDLSTAVYSGVNFSASTETSDTHGFTLSQDGLNAYVVDDAGDDIIYQYSITCS